MIINCKLHFKKGFVPQATLAKEQHFQKHSWKGSHSPGENGSGTIDTMVISFRYQVSEKWPFLSVPIEGWSLKLPSIYFS